MTFSTYKAWYEQHYGRELTCTEEQFQAALAQPEYVTYSQVDKALQHDFEFDVETERREGWGYD